MARAKTGAQALSAYMEARGIKQIELARLLGCNPGRVSRWLRGDGEPGRDLAWRLWQLSGIPLSVWTKRAA